jgi:pimeloyl-ACP methyl ester carboxylesterase
MTTRLSLLLLFAVACDRPAEAPDRPAPASRPAAAPGRTFSAKVSGHGRPMILIPGLGCSGEVWRSTVEHVAAAGYQAHVLTLAGFAGQPAVPGGSLDRVRREVIDYIRAEHLDHPVLVGHSLGGFLVFWIAATAPDAVGPVIAVDGVPFFPALLDPDATAESSRANAVMMRDMLAVQGPEEFARQNRAFLSQMITGARDVDEVARESGRSDPAAVGRAVHELMTTDIRPLLSAIRTPVLLVAAGQGSDAGALARYQSQVSAVPRHRVVVAARARHFVMLDDPRFLFGEMDEFLAGAAAGN